MKRVDDENTPCPTLTHKVNRIHLIFPFMSCKTTQHVFQAYTSINSTSINPKQQQQQQQSNSKDYYVARGQKWNIIRI